MQAINEEELNKILKRAQELVSRGNINIVTINGCNLIVFEDGTIIRIKRTGNHKMVENVDNHQGYNRMICKGGLFMRHRIIAYSFLNLDIKNVKSVIDHKDHNKLNNHVDNLRVGTQQQNTLNRTAAGFYWNKRQKKYHAQIQLKRKNIFLGYFITATEARQAYSKAKSIYHVI